MKKIIVIILIIILLGIPFYWFAIRPSQIRKQCSSVPVKTYPQERINEAKKYVDENCPKGGVFSDKTAECAINRAISSAPPDGQRQNRSATDEEYIKCLRENGLNDGQSLSNKQLKNLQQGVSDQSAKIENLRKENNDRQSDSSSSGIQAIIESSKAEADRENQECQQDLSEYNTCLSEYNSKMAEYNSCLSESSDPNSWRHNSFCSKPSNYCFKPLCAY